MAQEQEPPERYTRVLALGLNPPWIQEQVGNILRRVPPPEGSTPPSPLAIGAVGSEAKGQPLALKRMSEPYAVPGAGQVTLFDGDAVSGEVWKKIPAPKASHSLLLCWRKPGAPTWDEVNLKFLPDSRAAFGPGKIRMINLAPVKVSVQLNDEVFTLGAGKGEVRDVKVGENPIAVRAQVKKKIINLTDRSVQVNEGERVQVFIYQSDIKGARSPLQFFMEAEPAKNYQPPKPKKGSRRQASK